MIDTLSQPQEVHHICISWNNSLQDLNDTTNLVFNNTSTIFFTDGSQKSVGQDDPLNWQWFVVDSTGQKQLVSTDFNLSPISPGILPYSGYMNVVLQCTEVSNGRIWSHAALTKCVYNLASGNPPPSPPLFPAFPAFEVMLSEQLLTAHGQVMAVGKAAHFPAEHFVGGFTAGDLNADGAVNVQDLLEFTSDYGKTANQ